MTKTERRTALRNYALSGLLFGVVTGALRSFGGLGVQPPHARGAGLIFFVMTVLLCSLIGLLIGVVVLWFEKRADAKRRRLSEKMPKQDDPPLRIR
jgi:NhaP-type Na+/H+ or K+/H+ antiporter